MTEEMKKLNEIMEQVDQIQKVVEKQQDPSSWITVLSDPFYQVLIGSLLASIIIYILRNQHFVNKLLKECLNHNKNLVRWLFSTALPVAIAIHTKRFEKGTAIMTTGHNVVLFSVLLLVIIVLFHRLRFRLNNNLQLVIYLILLFSISFLGSLIRIYLFSHVSLDLTPFLPLILSVGAGQALPLPSPSDPSSESSMAHWMLPGPSHQPHVAEEVPQDGLRDHPVANRTEPLGDIEVKAPLMSDQQRQGELEDRLNRHFIGKEIHRIKYDDLIEKQLLIEKKIEMALLNDEYTRDRILANRYDIRESIFYKNGTPLKESTLDLHLKQIIYDPKDNIPYRKIKNDIQNFDLFFSK